LIEKDTSQQYRIDQKKRDLNAALEEFNKAFSQLFKTPTADEPNPEYILDHTRPILNEFDHGLDINLRYLEATPSNDYKEIKRNDVRIEIKYAGKEISKPHLFLNEARLSAIAISIYLGMIKRHPQLRPYKILFLDDIFIGLDISNRLPLLKILEDHFPEYQVYITTYDRTWFEYVRGFLGTNWKVLEFYAQDVNGGYEIPKIVDGTDLIRKSRFHYNNSDYKASAVYARSAFEKIIVNYCVKKRKELPFKKKWKDYSSQDFWNKAKGDLANTTVTRIEGYRFLIYNKLSHYDPESNPLKSELNDAINGVENLKNKLNSL